MLERYYVRPETIDRIRSAWIGPLVDQYVTWMVERGYSTRNLAKRVPLLLNFGAFARREGATDYAQLPGYVEAFVHSWVHRPDRRRGIVERAPEEIAADLRGPIQQMLQLLVHRPVSALCYSSRVCAGADGASAGAPPDTLSWPQ